MKVLLLTDEQWSALQSGAPWSDVKTNSNPRLPGAKELHRLAREGGTPEVFDLTRERAEALAEASDEIRGRLHKLLAEADELGVKPAALQRWTGYSARRIHQLTRS